MGSMEAIYRVLSLLPASSAFPRTANHETMLTTHKHLKRTNCKMFGNHEYMLFDECRK